MFIKHLSVYHFRNLTHVELTPERRFNIIAGPNASGKSSLLEAIYVLGNVRSFRPGRNPDLIQTGTGEARVQASVSRAAGPLRLEVIIDAQRKRYLVEDKPAQSLSRYFGTLPTVIFSPADLQLLRGPASDRRRFLDRMVSTAKLAHLSDLQDLEVALKNRNALLKDPRSDRELLASYTDQFVPLAARITARRLRALETLVPLAQRDFAAIFATDIQVSLSYASSWFELIAVDLGAAAEGQLEGRLHAALAQQASAERHVGHTLVGPQRDDFELVIGGRAAREQASQGQLRSAMLALKLTEIHFTEQALGETPILLLDDVSSELDKARNEQLFRVITGLQAQTFITTTDRRHIQIDRDYNHFEVVGGVVSTSPGS